MGINWCKMCNGFGKTGFTTADATRPKPLTPDERDEMLAKFREWREQDHPEGTKTVSVTLAMLLIDSILAVNEQHA